MPLRKEVYSLANVLELVEGSDSEFEGYESESDGKFSPYYSDLSSKSDKEYTVEDHRDDTPDKSDQRVANVADEESEWESDEDIPLSNMAKLTPIEKYQWCNTIYQPPDDVQFHGDIRLPYLPTNNGEVTSYGLFKMFAMQI